MNFLDLLPDDVIEKINYHLSKLDINEKRTERKKKRKMQKEKKKMAKQYKICEKLLEKAYYKYNNIKDFEFVLGGEFPYIKVTFHDNRFNEVVTILIFD
jgi:hypothetical protein